MIASTSGNSKIVKRKIANDVSYTFSVVKNERVNGHPTHKTLAIVGCFRKSQFTARAVEFWKIADAKLSDLVGDGTLWVNDKSKILRNFEAVIPRPATTVIKTVVTSPETNYETLKTVISEISDKAIQKLKERGRSL
jgi:hypothetical protein